MIYRNFTPPLILKGRRWRMGLKKEKEGFPKKMQRKSYEQR